MSSSWLWSMAKLSSLLLFVKRTNVHCTWCESFGKELWVTYQKTLSNNVYLFAYVKIGLHNRVRKNVWFWHWFGSGTVSVTYCFGKFDEFFTCRRCYPRRLKNLCNWSWTHSITFKTINFQVTAMLLKM